MNVRDYMHEVTAVNTNTKSSDENQGEGKKKMSKAEALDEQLNKNKELTMHIYKVLAIRSKGFDEHRRGVLDKVVRVTEKMVRKAMETDFMFQEYFTNKVCNEDLEMTLVLVEASHYEMRIYLKSFPVPKAFEMCFGGSYGVPHGSAKVTINRQMGRVDKMIIRREWEKVLEDDDLSPLKIVPWFADGLIRAIKSIEMDKDDPDHKNVSVTRIETGIQLEILQDRHDGRENPNSSKPSAISVSCIPAIFGKGLPTGMRLQHALPNREPYASQGKQLVDELLDEIEEGKSLYSLDACLTLDSNGDPTGGHWITNFRSMTARVFEGARKFGKTNNIDPAIQVIEMISVSRNWDIPLTIIETAALWEYKKAAHIIRNEAVCFKNVLNRLHEYFKTQSCPHFLLANYNMLKSEDPSWCEVIAKELGDAIDAINEEPSMLLELTGVKRKDKRDNQTLVHDVETASVKSNGGGVAEN